MDWFVPLGYYLLLSPLNSPQLSAKWGRAFFGKTYFPRSRLPEFCSEANRGRRPPSKTGISAQHLVSPPLTNRDGGTKKKRKRKQRRNDIGSSTQISLPDSHVFLLPSSLSPLLLWPICILCKYAACGEWQEELEKTSLSLKQFRRLLLPDDLAIFYVFLSFSFSCLVPQVPKYDFSFPPLFTLPLPLFSCSKAK